MKAKFFIMLSLLSGNTLLAQNVGLTANGVIEYEKSINTHALMKNNMTGPVDRMVQSSIDNYKANHPQFKLLKSSLAFSGTKTLFSTVPDEESTVFSPLAGHPLIDQINIIYTDLAEGTSVTQKKVFEEIFLVKDKPRKIEWKITTETREIAGYTCRRANAIIMDSVYVVAFYTGQIPVSGGPESFSGLPGMILGVALPHENINWFATKVTASATPPIMVAPSKGKPIDNKVLRATLDQLLKFKGEYARIYLKGLLL